MFRREIAAVRPPRDGRVEVPTGTWLEGRTFLRHPRIPGVGDSILEQYLCELAGDAHEEGLPDVHLIVPDHAWLVDGRPAGVDDVRRLPATDAARVRLLMHGQPVDPSECVPWFVPLRAIDRAFHLGIGPYVPSLGGSPRTMVRGRRIDDPSWNMTALTAVLRADVGWRAFTEPEEVRRLARGPTFKASRDRVGEIAACGDAVVCRVRCVA
jgi:hypothetical protein